MKKTLLTFLIFLTFLLTSLPFVKSEERSVTVKPKRDLSVEAKKGVDTALLNTKYHAIIIGNNNYKYIKKLNTAIADANAVDKILREKFGFKTKVLLDATRKEILDTMNDFRKKLGGDDSFLIYYAGHGEFDKTADKSYWLPVDALSDSPTEWIMADDITSNIKRIISRHILIVSDSCYSGTLTRAVSGDLSKSGEMREEFIKKMIERPSRTLMASGGNEPVSDSGGGSHSVFASSFLKALNEADKPFFTAEEIFHGRVKEIVTGKSEQVPEYNKIKNSGDKGGDFVFQVKTASLNPPIPPLIKGGEGGLEAPLPPTPVVLQGHLQVNVNAPSARIYVNGDEKGTASPGSPLNMENLSTGTASIRVEAEGYESGQRTVTIQRNQWTQEVFELKRVQVASLPPPPQITPPLKKGGEGGFNMVLIPSGEFMAGVPGSLKGMVISEFYIDKYEVTQREYEQVMGKNPSIFKGSDRPVEQVTWFEADEYCRKVGKRLPTEWEWEKAAKAGTTTTYYWGESESMADSYAWYYKNSDSKPHPVRQKKPNAYGLYDMAGNVWEWTASDYDGSGKYKTLRVGSWYDDAGSVRPSLRISSAPADRYAAGGFRCAQ
ncbi:MAG: SUMF1/EgtB/PvdO family nonheme iron enzyme [Nitrospinae bacterium]|nr:SUMF1/EgtB/PvdO family nonheme iron enzyme [Nitrospinota bacterium]